MTRAPGGARVGIHGDAIPHGARLVPANLAERSLWLSDRALNSASSEAQPAKIP